MRSEVASQYGLTKTISATAAPFRPLSYADKVATKKIAREFIAEIG